MTHEQIAEVKSDVEEIERMLKGSDEGNLGAEKDGVGYFRHASDRLDVAEIQKELFVKKKRLRDGTPVKLTGEASNKAYAYAQKLRKAIIANIPKDIYIKYPKGQGNDFEKSVDQQVWWQQHGTRAIDTYYHWMRRVDPNYREEDFEKYRKERV